MKDKITAAEYTVVLTPDEVGVDPSEFTFEGEVSALGEIVFLNNYLILADNTYQKGYAYVKGYDQFGTEINLAGLTVTCGVGDMTAYDSKTGKLTLESDTANAYMFIKQVPVFVSYQTGDGIISAQANLEVSTRSFVDEIEFGEIKKDGTARADGRVTITELASKKYYVELTTVKDQYGNDLSYKDLNKMVAPENILFVIPGERNGAYYTTNGFDEIDGTTILWLAPADDPKPGSMDLSLTGAGGYTASTPVEIEDDPYIQTINITYPQLYAGHSKSANLAFSAVDQYGEDIDMWDVRPTLSADKKTLTFADKNHMTGKATEIKLSGDVTFNAVIEDTTAKTWTVNINATAATAKSMIVATTLTAGMVPYTKTITIGAQGQAINVLSKLSADKLELNPKSNTKVNFNQYLQFEDVNGEVMNRIDSEQYPIFSNDATIVLKETDSNVKVSDYTAFYWYLSDMELPATSAYQLNGTSTAGGAARAAAQNPTLDPNGEITNAELAAAATASKKYYVTVVGFANGNYYKLSEQDFRVTYIPAKDIADGVLGDMDRQDEVAGTNHFDPSATTNKYSAKISGPIYVNKDNGTKKDVELTVTNDTGETYTLPLGDGYRVSTDSGLKIDDNGYTVSGKVSGVTSGTATLDVWLTYNDKKVATITVDYTNADPVPTSVKYEGTQSVANSKVASKVGAEYTFAPATRVETSKTTATEVTAKDGKITITNANNVLDTYTAQVKDQYGVDWKKAEFYVNGVKSDYTNGALTAGKEYVFKIVAGTVTKEITVVPGIAGGKMNVTQVKDYDKSISAPNSQALVSAAATPNTQGTTTITLTKDINLGAALNIAQGVKVVVPNGIALTDTADKGITIAAGGALVIENGGLLDTTTSDTTTVTIGGDTDKVADTDGSDGYLTVDGYWYAKTITNNGVINGSGHAEATGGLVTNPGVITVEGLSTFVFGTGSTLAGAGLLTGHVRFSANGVTVPAGATVDGVTDIDAGVTVTFANNSTIGGELNIAGTINTTAGVTIEDGTIVKIEAGANTANMTALTVAPGDSFTVETVSGNAVVVTNDTQATITDVSLANGAAVSGTGITVEGDETKSGTLLQLGAVTGNGKSANNTALSAEINGLWGTKVNITDAAEDVTFYLLMSGPKQGGLFAGNYYVTLTAEDEDGNGLDKDTYGYDGQLAGTGSSAKYSMVTLADTNNGSYLYWTKTFNDELKKAIPAGTVLTATVYSDEGLKTEVNSVSWTVTDDIVEAYATQS